MLYLGRACSMVHHLSSLTSTFSQLKCRIYNTFRFGDIKDSHGWQLSSYGCITGLYENSFPFGGKRHGHGENMQTSDRKDSDKDYV